MFASEFGNKPISGATAEVLAGKFLPAEIARLSTSNSSFPDLLKSGEATFLSGHEEFYRAARLYWAGMLAGSLAGDGLTALLDERANQLPPSTSDLVAYFALRDGIGEIGSGASHDYPSLESLASYTTVQNPVYRLLALEASAKALPHGITQPPIEEGKERAAINEARLILLRNYVNETDPVIVSKLVETISRIGTDEAQDTLKLINEQQAKLRER